MAAGWQVQTNQRCAARTHLQPAVCKGLFASYDPGSPQQARCLGVEAAMPLAWRPVGSRRIAIPAAARLLSLTSRPIMCTYVAGKHTANLLWSIVRFSLNQPGPMMSNTRVYANAVAHPNSMRSADLKAILTGGNQYGSICCPGLSMALRRCRDCSARHYIPGSTQRVVGH
jgi:hypothetical protein